MSYDGPERRRRKVLVTRNTEYHLDGRTCVGVRSDAGEWASTHRALGHMLEGSLGFSTGGGYEMGPPDAPRVGHRLCFSNDLLTSQLVEIRRPSQDTVTNYRLH